MKESAIKIVRKLQEAGFQAVLAGGSVRDMIMGHIPSDYDIATSATPDQVEALFEKTTAVGKAFGVVVVIMEGVEFEVATFRKDSGTSADGRHPDSVSFSSMEEDAKRRDITINGMFFDPIANKVYDFVDGRKDLSDGIIRLIGEPEKRIEEDKLRMLRVIRFGCRFDYAIEINTMKAIADLSYTLNQVSIERISEEFLKILETRDFRRALTLLIDTGLMKEFLPEVITLQGVEQPVDYHPEGDCMAHTIKTLEALPKDASKELLFGTLLHDIGKPKTQAFAPDRIRFNEHDDVGAKMTKEICDRMNFSGEFTDHVVALVKNHMRFSLVKKMRESKLKRFMRLHKFEEHMELHKADCLASHGGTDNYDFVKEKLNTFEPEDIKPVRFVTGKDLIDAGFTPGPKFKWMLEMYEDAQLEHRLKSREEALSYLKNHASTGFIKPTGHTCSASSGIHEGITFGTGELSDHGYWEHPCYECARAWEIQFPQDGPAWPFSEAYLERHRKSQEKKHD